jgi:GTP-binding protein
MTFTIAIVGRPNVGKSTLFNRLVGRRVALVDDRPGVTRDRREGNARLGDIEFTVIDTAGLEDAAAESLSGRMRTQTEAAIADADAIFFMIDARIGPLPEDHGFADLVRRSGKPAMVIANKSEGKAGEVVGRPNVGKSTLINRLLGEERLLTGPEAGITRDAIAVPLEWHGQHFRVYDTAGMRRRSKVQEKLEKLSVADALDAIRFAEVVVVLMDSERPFEDQDMRIADLVEREGRALVMGMSKTDLIAKQGGGISKLREEMDHRLPQVKGVPIVPVSGLTGEGLDRLMRAIAESHAVWNRRVPTSALNRWLGEALAEHAPPAVSGRRLKLYYITQHKARPPSFILSCTRADAVPDAYKRYLVNGLREAFDLPGTPIRLMLREKENPFKGRKRN